MKKFNLRLLLSAICVVSIFGGFAKTEAAPIRFNQVVQIIDSRPGRAETGSFSRLLVTDDFRFLIGGDGDEDKKTKAAPPQDGRVITETKIEIVTDDICDCEEEVISRRGFPKYALLGLAAIPIAIILIRRNRDTPTPTPTPPGMTPTPPPPGMTPTPTPPGMTPTPTPPGMTPTPTPPPPGMTPTPPPEPVPEPMTIILFGTGLASIGLAARRKFGKKGESSVENEEE